MSKSWTGLWVSRRGRKRVTDLIDSPPSHTPHEFRGVPLKARIARYAIVAILASFFVPEQAFASVDNSFKNAAGEVFLKGSYVEVGVGLNGHFGTSSGLPSAHSSDLHPKNGSNIGFVGDRFRNGTWMDGDFFLPGSPYEGWYTDVSGTNGKFDNSANSGATGTQTFSDVTVTSSSMSVVHTTVVNGVQIDQTYSVPIGTGTFVGDQQLNISVTMTNISGTSKANLYYARSVDPDNLVNQTGSGSSYSTYNRIESQYGVGGKTYSLVSATSPDARQAPAGTSYLGLFSADSRSKVGRYVAGFGTPASAATLYNGTGLVTSVEGSSTLGDAGITMAFNIGTLGAGESTTFNYAYILSSSSAASAVASASAPPAPTAVGANQSVRVSWTVPTSVDTITGYAIRYAAGSPTGATNVLTFPGDTSTAQTVTGLINGTSYYFAVAAISTNSSGVQTIGTYSDTGTATPVGVPGSFTINSHSYTGETSTISFVEAVSTSPTDPVTNYEYSLDGGTTWIGLSPVDTSTPISLPGILAGHSYLGSLRAINANGAGPAVSLGTLYGPPVWLDTVTANASVGVSYSDAITAGLGVTYSISPTTALSDFGLSLNTSTGAITGSPTKAGTISFTLRATNENSYIETSVAIVASLAPGAPTWTGTSLPAMTTGSAVTIPTLSSGATLAFVLIGTLPSGLTFNTATGAISGTPTVAGAYDFTIRASNSSGSNPQRFTGTISSPAIISTPVIVWNTSSLSSMTAGTPTTNLLSAAGASTYSIVGGALPAGLTLDPSTGAITGTPSIAGAYSVTILASGSGWLPSATTFTGSVGAAVAVPTPTPTPTASPTTTPSNGGSSGSTSTGGTTSGLPILVPITPAPSVSPVANSGNISVLINGTDTKATLKVNSLKNGYEIAANGWTLNLNPLDSQGNPVPLNNSSQIVLAPDRLVGISGDGFLPNSPVNVYFFSTPSLIGTVITDSKGSFKEKFPVADGISVGNHVIQVNGFSPTKEIRSASVGLLVEGTSPSTNTSTGLNKGSVVVIPFSSAKYAVTTSSQLNRLKSFKFKKGASVTVIGYASATSGQDDIRVSLDRALEVKSALLKLHPDLTIKALGGGITHNKKCVEFSNQCAEIKVTK